MNRGPEPNDLTPDAPARLIDALRALPPRPPSVPPAVDDAILDAARARLKSMPPAGTLSDAPPHAPIRLFQSAGWMALAAAFVAGLGLIFLVQRPGPAPASLAREDIDRNGRVDILDAFALARRLQTDGVTDATFDLNGDRRVDQQDVDWIATRAVRLDPPDVARASAVSLAQHAAPRAPGQASFFAPLRLNQPVKPADESRSAGSLPAVAAMPPVPDSRKGRG